MWYEKNGTLKLDQPIFATLSRGGEYTYLLVAQQQEGSYKIHSYSWLDIKTGKYNSNCFLTAQEAIDHYKCQYNIYNGKLEVIK